MLIDHIGITVANIDKSKAFYVQALEPLGIVLIAEDEGWLGFGANDEQKAEFWFGEASQNSDQHGQHQTSTPMHIAFKAENRAQVDAFFHAAIAAGARCNGKPGLREIYHPNYYGAFVIDPDGHNIEAVCHLPE